MKEKKREKYCIIINRILDNCLHWFDFTILNTFFYFFIWRGRDTVTTSDISRQNPTTSIYTNIKLDTMKKIICLIFHHLFIRTLFTHDLRNKCVHIDYRGKDTTKESSACPNTPVCLKSFNISSVHMPPYSLFPIESLLRKCCGNCTKFTRINNFANITEVTPSSINTSDFVLLFLGNTYATTLYGYHFIPVVNAPSVFYITTKDEPVLVRLTKSCFSLYPLIVICLLMAAISGFLAWIMETWYNKEEFPRQFLIGWFEGFWWSFISMTTVGYGDKTPKTFFARIFSIIWILIGVAMFGMFTALLTAEIMKANFPPTPDISGANVGALKYREYEASVIAEHGGLVSVSEGWDFLSDMMLLIRKLMNKEIDGLLLDKYTLRYTTYVMEGVYSNKTIFHQQKDEVNFFLKNTIRTTKYYESEKLSYGILVKHDRDYEYFRDAIRDNRLPLETEIALDWNKKEDKPGKLVLFSSTGPYFIASIKVISFIFGSICFFGIFYEICRRRLATYEKQGDCVQWLGTT